MNNLMGGQALLRIVAEEVFFRVALGSEVAKFAELPCFLRALRAIAFVESKTLTAC